MALRMVINILLGGLGVFILTLIILFVFSLFLHISFKFTVQNQMW